MTSGEFDVISLHTVIDKDSGRVGLHGVQEALIAKQAEQIGLPLIKIYLPASDDHEVYKSIMLKFYHQCSLEGVDGIVFGDIFLEDLRDFRMALLAPSKRLAFFPLWKIDSKVLLSDLLDIGFKTTLCAADANFFSADQLGLVDRQFLDTLPSGVDPCGENGEFHTFVFDGPVFKKSIEVTKGEVVKKTYTYQKKESNGETKKLESSFWFQDYLLRNLFALGFTLPNLAMVRIQ